LRGTGEEMAATQGGSIDHLSWGFTDVPAAGKELKAKGVKFTVDITPSKNTFYAYIEGPGGVHIELVEFPRK
jgi:hypothetical protein